MLNVYKKFYKKLEKWYESAPKTKQGNPYSLFDTYSKYIFLWEALTDGVFEKGRKLGFKEGYEKRTKESCSNCRKKTTAIK